MGGARNLKLRAVGARARAQRAINILINILLHRPNVDLIQLLCALDKCSRVQEQSP